MGKERRVSVLKSGEMEKPGNCVGFFWQAKLSRDVPEKQHLISHQDNMTDVSTALSTFNIGLFSPSGSHEFSRTYEMFET